ncbi:YcaO-like family protein [Longimicrobium sp.]|uniref:YcaO-like family protein n=1 Tax=Longimicrobium sp. TaxID=2029185 RepID=UPI002C7C1583|nr:YcaO-like family protein [Longimicrobium sp.]HSU17055.1 YcaO-like family protein [Longimicrobium sp.]
MTTYRLPSSLRAVPPETTLAHAREAAVRLGISRVTDITRLDSVGIPVFAGVRPGAVEGSLCVNAGKGVRAIDARVGAYMEAIEFALAEPGASDAEVVMATPRDVLDGHRRSDAVLDFCPIANRGFDLSAPLACTLARELVGGGTTLVPAELVFLPYVHRPGTGNFGSHSNGLASGNTEAEALLHGLLEVVERDVRSFAALGGGSMIIPDDTLPDLAREQLEKVRAAGLGISVRVLPNEFGVPCFEAVTWDPYARTPLYLNGGYGCHLHREIALLRAVTEAVQSRLSWIHGGRDDLLAPSLQVAEQRTALARQASEQFRAHQSQGERMDYDAVPELAGDASSVDEALAAAMERLLERGVRHVCLVNLSRPGEPLQVVRVIVPRLEYLDRESHRVGPRLQAFIRQRRTAAATPPA